MFESIKMSSLVRSVSRTNIDRSALGCENPGSKKAEKGQHPPGIVKAVSENSVQGFSHLTSTCIQPLVLEHDVVLYNEDTSDSHGWQEIHADNK